MSKTAVIVSGTLRHLVNASSSWTIPGDYFLIVDENIYTTASDKVQGSSFDILSENIKNCHVKFKSVTVCVDNNLPQAEFKTHASINMLNKWKLAYYALLPYNVMHNYDRIIILRPDIYLFPRQPIRKLLDIVPQNDEIYSTIGITKSTSNQHPERDVMNDVLLMVNLHTFGRLANEGFAYFVANHQMAIAEGYEVHSLMAKFVNEKSIVVRPDLINYFEFAILRNNTVDLFELGLISQHTTFLDIKRRSEEWWREAYENNIKEHEENQKNYQ